MSCDGVDARGVVFAALTASGLRCCLLVDCDLRPDATDEEVAALLRAAAGALSSTRLHQVAYYHPERHATVVVDWCAAGPEPDLVLHWALPAAQQ